MKAYTIVTHESVGPLKFGMTREEIRSILKVPFKSLKLTTMSKEPADAFQSLGIVAHYVSDGCVAIEFSGPADPDFNGTELLGMEEPEQWFMKQDPNAEIDDSDFTSKTLGFGFFVEEDEVKSVIVAADGYFV